MSAASVVQTASYPLAAAYEVLLPPLAEPETGIIAAKCMGLITGYAARWANAPYFIDDVECVISADLYNPKSERRSRTFSISGKIDVRMREMGTGARVIMDHKTTSHEIAGPHASYWRQLTVEAQPTHYMLLEWLNGNRVDYAIWDVVRKPCISPRLLSKKELDTAFLTGLWFDYDIAAEAEELREAGRETLRMFAARLADDCTAVRPEWYFQRRPVPRLESELWEYGTELWHHAQDILWTRRNGSPRNSGACMLHNSPCKFLGICSGHDTPDSANWTKRTWVHPELPILDSSGKEILTNSRIRTFQTCRRKHELQYEIGIERVDAEDREALIFGDLYHRALEQFFLAVKSQQGE